MPRPMEPPQHRTFDGSDSDDVDTQSKSGSEHDADPSFSSSGYELVDRSTPAREQIDRWRSLPYGTDDITHALRLASVCRSFRQDVIRFVVSKRNVYIYGEKILDPLDHLRSDILAAVKELTISIIILRPNWFETDPSLYELTTPTQGVLEHANRVMGEKMPALRELRFVYRLAYYKTPGEFPKLLDALCLDYPEEITVWFLPPPLWSNLERAALHVDLTDAIKQRRSESKAGMA